MTQLREDPGPAPARKQSLSDKVHEMLRRDIICCALEPSSEVTESELTDRYDVGKAPVRAALSRLFQEGLVRPLPRRGYVIAPLTFKDIHECMSVRLILEPETARLAATRMTAEAVAELRKRTALDPKADRTVSFEKNRAFHIGIARAAGNGRLERMVTELIDQMERVSRLLMQNREAGAMKSEFATDDADHEAILDAIEKQDPAAAQQAARQHLETTQRMIVDALFSSENVELRLNVG